MKVNVGKWSVQVSHYVSCVILLGSLTLAATHKTTQVAPGERTRITGSIVSRSGDLIQLREKKSDELVVVTITNKTRIERKKGGFPFFRHADMDVTAMLPGLTIDAEGVGNAKGQLEANKISFTPDDFALEVAAEQQVITNGVIARNARSAASEGIIAASEAQHSANDAQVLAIEADAEARNAQSTANQGVAGAGEAQYSADHAQALAIEADAGARTAGTVAIKSARAVSMLKARVSDLDDYKNEFEVDVFFARNEAVLDDTAEKDLANLADIAKSLNGYLIEISGYSSNTLSAERDQQVSEERAAAVVRYFTEVKDVPMRRILVPVGYGRTRPVAANTDAKGRELNRRVDIKVLVNKALSPAM